MICWVITGAGHFARECVSVVARFAPLDLYLTRAAEEVLAMHGLLSDYEHAACGADNVFRESTFSAPRLVKFAGGRYDLLVIAPATSNTVAKCALGIADSVASTFFSQAGKACVPTILLPTDSEPEIVSAAPNGKKLTIRPRAVELQRVSELSTMDGVTVVRTVEALSEVILRSLVKIE